MRLNCFLSSMLWLIVNYPSMYMLNVVIQSLGRHLNAFDAHFRAYAQTNTHNVESADRIQLPP